MEFAARFRCLKYFVAPGHIKASKGPKLTSKNTRLEATSEYKIRGHIWEVRQDKRLHKLVG
uniref:Uncharacterized protein n=1 Tax=Oryza meridionalis TaxID=40149 RepID=A0A0E0F6V0_9ORYZ